VTELFTLIGKLYRKAERVQGRALARYGVTPKQFAVLQIVAYAPGASRTMIKDKTGLSRTTVCDVLGDLAAKGLIYLRDDVKFPYLTEDGRDLLDNASPYVAALEFSVVEAAAVEGADSAVHGLNCLISAVRTAQKKKGKS